MFPVGNGYNIMSNWKHLGIGITVANINGGTDRWKKKYILMEQIINQITNIIKIWFYCIYRCNTRQIDSTGTCKDQMVQLYQRQTNIFTT